MIKRKGDERKITCSFCGHEITEEESENYDGKCWECWDDEFSEESE